MKTKAQFIITTFVASITLAFLIIFFIKFIVGTINEHQDKSSRFEQAYQKVQYFDSLSQVYTDQNNLYMMIDCRDSMMYYFGEMIKNLKEE